MYNKNFTCIQRDVSSGEVSDLQADKQRIENANIGIEIQTAHIVLLNRSISITGNKFIAYRLELEKMGQTYLMCFNPIGPIIARIVFFLFSQANLNAEEATFRRGCYEIWQCSWLTKNPEV